MNSLADRIRRRMTQTGVTKVELARAAGTTRQAVYQWLSGETKTLRGETLVAAARVLKANPDWLGSGKGDELAEPQNGTSGLSPEAVEVARAWMLLPDYKQKGYAQGIMVDAAVCNLFPAIEKAMRSAAVATSPSYHKTTEKFVRAREQLERQFTLNLEAKTDP